MVKMSIDKNHVKMSFEGDREYIENQSAKLMANAIYNLGKELNPFNDCSENIKSFIEEIGAEAEVYAAETQQEVILTKLIIELAGLNAFDGPNGVERTNIVPDDVFDEIFVMVSGLTGLAKQRTKLFEVE